METKPVVIIGGGIAGLASVLELHGSGRALTIIERDAPPPEITPERAFELWERPGVPQFRHAHIFLARLQTALRDRHPELLRQLLAAGFTLSTIEEILPHTHYRGIAPEPGDGDLLHLWGRRATFEYVVRRYVGALPNVTWLHNTRVTGLLTRREHAALTVHGVEVLRADRTTAHFEAELVIDASGSASKAAEWLGAQGHTVSVQSHASGFTYACRHYRLKNPQSAPPRERGGGNYDYLGYATFYAEHGHYALTFSTPDEDTDLTELIKRADGFEALCSQLPVLQQWTAQSLPTSKVLGAGRFENRWRNFTGPAEGTLLGFFAVGDAQLLTNPMYGRGCASAFVQAGALAEVLGAVGDPAQRAQRYHARTRELLQPYFELSVATDRMYRTRASRHRGVALTLPEKLLDYAYERVWMPATHHYPLMAREFLRSVQMREISPVPVRVATLFLMIAAWVQSLARSSYKAEPPPRREDFLRRVRLRTASATATTPPTGRTAAIGSSSE